MRIMRVAGHVPGAISAPFDRTGPLAPRIARAGLVLFIGLAVFAGVTFASSPVHDSGLWDPGLVRLLRAMAVIKAAMAAVVIAGIFWRLGVGAAPLAFAAYLAVSAALASGPILIWGMTHLVLGALLTHAGLFAGLVLLFQDPATTRQLTAMIAARRRARG